MQGVAKCVVSFTISKTWPWGIRMSLWDYERLHVHCSQTHRYISACQTTTTVVIPSSARVTYMQLQDTAPRWTHFLFNRALHTEALVKACTFPTSIFQRDIYQEKTTDNKTNKCVVTFSKLVTFSCHQKICLQTWYRTSMLAGAPKKCRKLENWKIWKSRRKESHAVWDERK